MEAGKGKAGPDGDEILEADDDSSDSEAAAPPKSKKKKKDKSGR